jgi:outer membrane protein OmpA-like peptidoglycan-associated protein
MRLAELTTCGGLVVLALAATVIGPAARAQSSDEIIQALEPAASAEDAPSRGVRRPAADFASAQAVVATTARPSRAAYPAPSLCLSVQFRPGSAELTQAAMRTLDALGKALSARDLAAYRFRIEGHTDTTGSADTNKALSEQRAAAVVAYLVGKFGVAPGRLKAVGMGEEGLAVATGNQVAEPRNRRVLVVNLGT